MQKLDPIAILIHRASCADISATAALQMTHAALYLMYQTPEPDLYATALGCLTIPAGVFPLGSS